MERQLKERLIGAAVLVAIAVVMVPEMFSGANTHPPAVAATAASGTSEAAAQLRTFRIELQAPAAAPSPARVEPPAERPRDEVALSSASASMSAETQRDATGTSVVPAEPAAPAPVARPNESDKASASSTSAAGWVVQVGSFSSQDKARQIVAALKGQGYSAYLAAVTVSGKTLYRVRVGAAAERGVAEATLRKLQGTYPGASALPASR